MNPNTPIQRLRQRLFNSRRGPARTASWERSIDTSAARRNVLDMAIVHLQIATRNEGSLTPPQEEDPQLRKQPPLKGDYAEFGVFQGDTFVHVCKRAGSILPGMKFYAFDSFEGLPKPIGPDAHAEFSEGQFACSRAEFEAKLSHHDVDRSHVVIVPGWFSQSLRTEGRHQTDLKTVSLAYIDCDLYVSTVPVLEFLTDRVVQGSILLFDDWFCFRADAARGVQRAVTEWLARTPSLSLVPWQPFSHHGHSFFVNRSA